MNRPEFQRKALTVAAILVILPPLLLIATLMNVIQNPAPGANISAISIVLSLLGIHHLVFIPDYGVRSSIQRIRN